MVTPFYFFSFAARFTLTIFCSAHHGLQSSTKPRKALLVPIVCVQAFVFFKAFSE